MTDEEEGPGPDGRAFVHDPDVPLDDDERQHYAEMIRPQAVAGNAMAILACRAMKGMEAVQELLVDYSVIVEQGGNLCKEALERAAGDGGLDVPEVVMPALFALAAHARMSIALAVLIDRHRLADDERELVEQALRIQPRAEYERGIANQAIGLFIEEIERRGFALADGTDLTEMSDPDVAAAVVKAAQEVVEGTEAAIQTAWDRQEARADA